MSRGGLSAAMVAVALVGLLAGYGAWHTGVGRNLELQTIDARRAEVVEAREARRDQKLTDEYALRRSRGSGD